MPPQADDLDKEGNVIWTGSSGICTSRDLRTLAVVGKATDELWHAILLEGRGAAGEVYLMPSYMYQHIHMRRWQVLEDIPTNRDCALVVPESHGRMACRITWKTGSIIYYNASGQTLTKQNRGVLDVSYLLH